MATKAFRTMMARAIAIGASAAASPAWAQAGETAVAVPAKAPAAADEANGAAADDEAIVVTAQKRAENVQDVPISIAAFSGLALTKANVVTVQDIGRVATNFQASKGV